MSDVVYMYFSDMRGYQELRIPFDFDDLEALAALKPGWTAATVVPPLFIDLIDFGANRATKPPMPTWVRVVCKTYMPLKADERARVQMDALELGVKTGVLAPEKKKKS